jgi:hypothetical protein
MKTSKQPKSARQKTHLPKNASEFEKRVITEIEAYTVEAGLRAIGAKVHQAALEQSAPFRVSKPDPVLERRVNNEVEILPGKFKMARDCLERYFTRAGEPGYTEYMDELLSQAGVDVTLLQPDDK